LSLMIRTSYSTLFPHSNVKSLGKKMELRKLAREWVIVPSREKLGT